MNYLAHLYLAQPNPDSYYGNLLGDFGGKKLAKLLPTPIKLALDNHYLVDKFTDSHTEIKHAKLLFSNKRKRFSGIALDVLFDHFLIKNWHQFSNQDFNYFKHDCYNKLQKNLPIMPSNMQHVISRITQDDWFKSYETAEGIGIALDNIAKRIRFNNEFSGAIEDINKHYDELNQVFLRFFPQLIDHVSFQAVEKRQHKIFIP